MASKIIPDLAELAAADLQATDLLIVDNGTATYKVTVETLAASLPGFRSLIDVELDGVETGEKEVDVSAYVADARNFFWILKKPLATPTFGEQMPATTIRTPDAATVVIDTGDFALEAGTYKLLGV